MLVGFIYCGIMVYGMQEVLINPSVYNYFPMEISEESKEKLKPLAGYIP